MAVAVASMTASLISKLSLRQEDKPVDPSNLKCQGKGFVAPRFYLVGKLNSTRVVQFDSFCSAVCACDMEGLHDHGGEACPRAIEMAAAPEGQTGAAGTAMVPPMVFRACSQPTLVVPNLPVLFKEKPVVQIREVEPFPLPARVSWIRRAREEDDADNGKRVKHSLAMVPLELNPEDLGFSMAAGGALGIMKT
ncbi:hypothetical protein ACLB2K_022228 [Fragaria x ananassa]